MKGALAKFVMAWIVLLSACSVKQTQEQGQIGVNQPVASAQKNPPSTPTQTKSVQESYKPKNGYVPDEQTAIAIAVAVWRSIYGEKQIEGEKPYKATLKDGIWTVTGSLPEGYATVGGTATAEISQDSGCILRVIHYQ